MAQCLGVLNSDAAITVEKEAGQASNTVVAENIIKMFSRFHGDISHAAWFINKNTDQPTNGH